MEGCLRSALNTRQLQHLVEKAKDYLVSHGFVVRTQTDPDNPDLVSSLGVMMFPSPVPRRLYQQAQDIQRDINLLMHRVAEDYDFLKQSLQQVIVVDDFTRRLWEIYNTVSQEGVAQPCHFGLLRSDYMFDCEIPASEIIDSKKRIDPGDLKLRQIETNTIASSMGGLCQQVEGLHRFMLERLKKTQEIKNLPPNPACQVLANGVAEAWKVYNNPDSVVLFLVGEAERNRFDQFHLECAIYEQNSSIEVIRRTIADLRDGAVLTQDKRLVIDENYEVAIIYMRSLYTPNQFTSEKDWETRLLMERSKAIKCPSAAYHLAGTKKIQQVLAQDGVMERFVPAEAAARIRQTFVKQYSLDLDEAGDRAVATAMSDSNKFVLKPQREGGGNNAFGDEICRVLDKIGRTEERTGYILMQLIHATPLRNYTLWPGRSAELIDCVSEMGVFGAFVGSKGDIILNESGGHILRTKSAGTNEGGVASGFSCLDSPYLID